MVLQRHHIADSYLRMRLFDESFINNNKKDFHAPNKLRSVEVQFAGLTRQAQTNEWGTRGSRYSDRTSAHDSDAEGLA